MSHPEIPEAVAEVAAAHSSLVSKVLVLDSDAAQHSIIKTFCDANDLVAVKVAAGNAMSVLRSNVDLGAVLLWEHCRGTNGGINIAREINQIRPDLPIFLRRDEKASLDDLPQADRRLFRVAYTTRDLEVLREAVASSLFNRVYPSALVRGITEVSKNAIEVQFKDVLVEHEAPCLVKDRIIFGELFSMIPLESNWCRGYMMLQTEEQELMDFVRCDAFGTAGGDGAGSSFREINSLLGEATNMVWGAFKNRFFSEDLEENRSHSQVPIIVNHRHRYISFGSDDPLLCVKYRLHDRRDPEVNPITVYQWFAFSLSWSPDKFKENVPSVDSMFASGELELF
ncbi:MAG: chemotaxis protein CheX [Rhizobacter sp.]